MLDRTDAGWFESRLKVNSLYHAYFPHKFGIMAYNTYIITGTGWIDETLERKMNPDSLF